MKRLAALITERGEMILSGEEQTPWAEYPRPDLVRESYHCLNGDWEFYVSRSEEADIDMKWERIRVPFPPQSILSGIHRDIPDGSYLWYRKTVQVPRDLADQGNGSHEASVNGERLILHIDAADQITDVYVDGTHVGTHEGGYSRASFDITDAVAKDPFELIIRVFDKLEDRVFPYGKQSLKRGGMWYTPVSGIWQSVWMETVPAEHVEKIKVSVFPLDGERYKTVFDITGIDTGELTVEMPDGENVSIEIENGSAEMILEAPRLWSPDAPYLYRFTVSAGGDFVRSYFAVRTINVRTIDGISRICLNGEPVFFNGLLDQGYWSDGLMTPASPSCFTDDIVKLKEIGFNTLRKHIKVEPDIFYYECDRLGMFVFQDMVNNGDYSFLRDTVIPTVGRLSRDDTKKLPSPAIMERFKCAMLETAEHLEGHPSIVLWTIFNEGWGQFSGSEMYALLKAADPSRLIDTASGWFAGCDTDIESRHVYFRKVKVLQEPTAKPYLVTEFGGYSWRPEGHCFNLSGNYGYGSYKSRDALVNAVRALYHGQVLPLVGKGLCGTIYTQVSDVEDETNGIFSYDRRVQKILPEEIWEIFDKIQKAVTGTL